MRIKIGDRYRDYINTLYVVKSYKDKIITFEVDNGKEKDEVLDKSLFESEINGNRFFRDTSPQTEISDEEIKEKIEKALNKFKQDHTVLNLYPSNMLQNIAEFGAKWYREQLKQKICVEK